MYHFIDYLVHKIKKLFSIFKAVVLLYKSDGKEIAPIYAFLISNKLFAFSEVPHVFRGDTEKILKAMGINKNGELL